MTFPQDSPAVNGNGVTTNGKANGKPGLLTSTTNGAGPKSPASPKSPMPSGMVNGFPKAGEDDWSRTSGPPRVGNIVEELVQTAGDTTEHQTWVAANLDDKFYGGMFGAFIHNTRRSIVLTPNPFRMVA